MILEFKIAITALLSFNIIFSLYAIFTDFIDWIKNKEYRKKVNLKLKDVICFANISLLFFWLILPIISIIVFWVWGQEMKKRDTSGLPIKTLEDYLVEKETKYNTTRLIIFYFIKEEIKLRRNYER